MWARIRKFFSPPVFTEDEEKTRIASLLNTILLIVLLMAAVFAISAYILNPSFKRVLIGLSIILTVVFVLALMRRGRVRLASAIFSAILLIVVSVGTYSTGGFQGSTMSAYFGIILIAGLLLGPWVALGFGLTSIAFTGWLAYADIHQLLPPVPEFATTINLWGEFSSVLISVVGLISLVLIHLQRARESTKRKENELAYKLVESEQLAIWAQEASDFKTHLLARVSHELRTPLGIIVGMAEMLRLEAYGSMTDEQKKLLERIQVNSKFLETTFSELLEQTQLDREMLPMQVSSFSPGSILERVTPELREEAEKKGLRFSDRIAPDLPEIVWGIPSRIEQILFQLVNNAIKFTEKGSVEVSLIRRDEDRWSIRVTDTGIGIPKEQRESIFEPFRQVDETFAREYGGVGLGLSIVKRLTSSMKGTIRVESELGQGSVFTVTLPFVEPEMESTEL